MDIENLGLFLTASFFLWITPGQDTIYIIARSISQGKLAGIISALGIGTGALVYYPKKNKQLFVKFNS